MGTVTETEIVPFSVPYFAGNELDSLAKVVSSSHTQGDGPFTRSATQQLKQITGSPGNILLTTSCSHALDMSLQLLGVGPGDEVIVPSYNFPSAGNSVALRGAHCVFVDCDPHSGNVDPEHVIAASNSRTKAVIVMHYAGVPVVLEPILAYASGHGMAVIEDAAHGLGVQTTVGTLGTRGTFGAFSFHASKNLQCGEGGALLVNDPRYELPAEIVREKGTNRSQFIRGEVDKYTWIGRGSSYLPSEYNAAVLDAQLGAFDDIQRMREAIWNRYSTALADWAAEQEVELMQPHLEIHASHMFYLLTPTWDAQGELISHLRSRGVCATFHYQPLHSSPAGVQWGQPFGDLTHSTNFAHRVVRLPLWAGMSESQVERVIDAVVSWRVAS